MAINCGKIILNNGKSMPKFGLGTWLSEPGQVKTAVESAIDAGYRHIDCAFFYNNEHEVGEAILNKISEGVVKREDLFVTSKLWNTFHKPENVEKGLNLSLKDLKLDYVDLYLMHWPTGFEYPGDGNERDLFPGGPASVKMDQETGYVNCWKKFEEIYKKGEKVKAIGVSNFNLFQMNNLLKCCEIVPMMQQVELHGYENMKEMVDFCHQNKIQVTGYSPLGNPGRPDYAKIGQDVLMEDPIVKEIAEKHQKSAAQIQKIKSKKNIILTMACFYCFYFFLTHKMGDPTRHCLHSEECHTIKNYLELRNF